jgi:hypothetical protein
MSATAMCRKCGSALPMGGGSAAVVCPRCGPRGRGGAAPWGGLPPPGPGTGAPQRPQAIKG